MVAPSAGDVVLVPFPLFTAHAGLLVRSVGKLTPTAFGRVLSAVVALFQPPTVSPVDA